MASEKNSAQRKQHSEMMSAVMCGDVSKVQQLIAEYGISHCEEWLHGCALLETALAYDQLEMFETLVKAGAKLSNNEKKINILHKVLTKSLHYIPFLELILTKGANVNARDERGNSSLHIVGTVGMATLLFSSSAVTCPDVNAQNNDGQTPLHRAVSPGWPSIFQPPNVHVAKCLLAYGADVNIRDKAGRTPVEVIARYCSMDMLRSPMALEVAEALLSHVAKLKCADLHVSEDNLMACKRIRESDEEANSRDTLDDPTFVKRCKDEVDKMKNERIGDSSVSYYDVLSRSSRQLASYTRNSHVSCVMDSKKSGTNEFPIYGRWIDARYRLAKKGVQLQEKAVSSLTAMLEFPHICAELIANYLGQEDLKNLYDCHPGLDD